MIAIVEIDLIKDTTLMAWASADRHVQTMLIHCEDDDNEGKLKQVGRYIWTKSRFINDIQNICGDDLYEFIQVNALLFQFRTSRENAYLLKTACCVPVAIRIMDMTKIKFETILTI